MALHAWLVAMRGPKFRTLVNSAANLAGVLSAAAAAIAVTPILLRELGPAGFGIFSIQIGVLSILGINDLGISRAVVLRGIQRGGVRDTRRLANVVTKGITLSAVLALAVVLASPLALSIAYLFGAIGQDGILSWLLLASASAVAVVTLPLRAILEVQERFLVLNALRSISVASLFVGPAVVVLFWQTPWFVTAVILASRIIMLVLHAVVVLPVSRLVRWRQLVPGVGHVLLAKRWERFAPLVHLAGWLGLAGIGSTAIGYVDRFVLGGVNGPAEVAVYTVPAEIATRFWLVTGAVVAAMTPQIAKAWHSKSGSDTARLFKLLAIMLGIVIFPIQILVNVGGEYALRVWLGENFEPRMVGILSVLTLGIVINTASTVNFVAYQVGGRQKAAGVLVLISLPVTFAAYFAAATFAGAEGVAWAFAARLLLDAFVFVAFMPEGPGSSKVGLSWRAVGAWASLALAIHFTLA